MSIQIKYCILRKSLLFCKTNSFDDSLHIAVFRLPLHDADDWQTKSGTGLSKLKPRRQLIEHIDPMFRSSVHSVITPEPRGRNKGGHSFCGPKMVSHYDRYVLSLNNIKQMSEQVATIMIMAPLKLQ